MSKTIYDTTPRYRVKEVADITNLSVHTIRYYDDIQLLPFVFRDKNNIRLFSQRDLEWLRIIHCLRSTGMPLASVKHYVDLSVQGELTVSERRKIMLDQEQALILKINEMNQQLELIHFKIKHYEEILADSSQVCKT